VPLTGRQLSPAGTRASRWGVRPAEEEGLVESEPVVALEPDGVEAAAEARAEDVPAAAAPRARAASPRPMAARWSVAKASPADVEAAVRRRGSGSGSGEESTGRITDSGS
jgi:hypothetical protein